MSFRAAGDAFVRGTVKGLYKAGTAIMAESQLLVPVEYGTLKRSGHVEEPTVHGDHVSVTAGYGYGTEYETRATEEAAHEHDVNSPGYAVYVHEILRYKHAPPTMAKFLERPARDFEPRLGPMLRDSIKDELRREERP